MKGTSFLSLKIQSERGFDILNRVMKEEFGRLDEGLRVR